MLIAFHSRDLIVDYANMARESGRKHDLHVWYKANAIPFTANTWKSDLESGAGLEREARTGYQHNQAMHSKASDRDRSIATPRIRLRSRSRC